MFSILPPCGLIGIILQCQSQETQPGVREVTMARQRKEPTKVRRTHKPASALSQTALVTGLDQLSAEELQDLLYKLDRRLYFWMGDPTEQSLLSLRNMHPVLGRIIDFNTVLSRLSSLEKLDRGMFGVHLSSFFPELGTVRDLCVERVHRLASGIPKAEGWLKPIAQNAGADADLEAAIYFASRGKQEVIDPRDLSLSWHAAVCSDIELGKPVGPVPNDVRDRAQSRTISLAEAARILRFGESLPRFFSWRNEEDDFIDATMFRTVSWFGINGFEPWLDSAIADLSGGCNGRLEHSAGCWWLFHWCRSDLAEEERRPRVGVVALGHHEWCRGARQALRVFWGERQVSRIRDYIPDMGILPFVWHRIRPSRVKDDVVQEALRLLLQTQMRSGAWPLYVDSSDACLLSTVVAIHGLSMAKPSGWGFAWSTGRHNG